MPFFDYKDANIHYVDIDNRDDSSQGLPLIFIHGAGSSHICWALQLREFSKSNRTIAIDLSGHGKSDELSEEVSIEEGYALEVAGLVNHLELSDFILIGHSMGGCVAMSYSLKSDLVRPKSLVLVDTSPNLKLAELAPGLVKETLQDRFNFFNNKDHKNYSDAHRLKKLEEEMRLANPNVMLRDLNACNRFDIRDKVTAIDLPTFVLVGEHDDIISPEVVREFEADLPRSDLAVIRDASHTPMIEQHDEFNRLLYKFVKWTENTAGVQTSL